MLGLFNVSLEAFIVDTLGTETWERIREEAGLEAEASWVTSCPYADEQTYR